MDIKLKVYDNNTLVDKQTREFCQRELLNQLYGLIVVSRENIVPLVFMWSMLQLTK